jgi:hypothetical protein
MVCDALEVIVASEHQQAVANAQLRKQRIDRANLYAMATTGIAQFHRMNVILSMANC